MERWIGIELHWADVTVQARLLDELAPQTCDAVWQLASEGVSLEVCHAIFSGRELGLHVPTEIAQRDGAFVDLPAENSSAFPSPGDVMYQYCAPRQFAGIDEHVYDISICYGPDTRLLMPWGWSPANRFAIVRYEDRDALAAAGSAMVRRGVETLAFRRL
jgi:hypothetical protein